MANRHPPIPVSLDTSTHPWSLSVHQQGNPHHFDPDPNVQTITWQLTGEAATGSFNAQDDAKPGFAWIPPAPHPGIFDAPDPKTHKHQMTMRNHHHGASSAGEWFYQLSATIHGKLCQTPYTPTAGRISNPSIKNT